MAQRAAGCQLESSKTDGCAFKHFIFKQREIAVSVGMATSDRFSPEAGVPQGSTLSPLFCVMYISDIYIYPNPREDHVSVC